MEIFDTLGEAKVLVERWLNQMMQVTRASDAPAGYMNAIKAIFDRTTTRPGVSHQWSLHSWWPQSIGL